MRLILFLSFALFFSSTLLAEDKPTIEFSDAEVSRMMDFAARMKASSDRGDTTRAAAVERLKSVVNRMLRRKLNPAAHISGSIVTTYIPVIDPAKFKSVNAAALPEESLKAGDPVPPLMIQPLGTESPAKQLDAFAIAKDQPLVLVLFDDNPRGHDGLHTLTESIRRITPNVQKPIKIAAVYTGENAEWLKQKPSPLLESLSKHSNVVGHVIDRPAAFAKLRLPSTNSQMVLLANGSKIAHIFPFPRGMLTADPHILGGVAQLLDVDLKQAEAWLNSPKK